MTSMQADANALAAKYPPSCLIMARYRSPEQAEAVITNTVGPGATYTQHVRMMAQLLHGYHRFVEQAAKFHQKSEQQVRDDIAIALNTAHTGGGWHG